MNFLLLIISLPKATYANPPFSKSNLYDTHMLPFSYCFFLFYLAYAKKTFLKKPGMWNFSIIFISTKFVEYVLKEASSGS